MIFPKNTQPSLLHKLALLKLCGWLIACAVCVIFYGFMRGGAIPVVLIVCLLAGGIACALGFVVCGQLKAASPKVLLIYLLSDILFLSWLIHITGGIMNPFTSSLLVPVALGVALLPRYLSLLLIGIACTIYGFWLVNVEHGAMMHQHFSMHLYGMGANFMVSAVLLYVFVTHSLEAVKTRELELNLAREEILKNEQLVGIASLTANTAHALGTPLQTLTLITNDLDADRPMEHSDLDIIKQQLSICKNYLRQLVRAAHVVGDDNTASLAVLELNTKLQEHYSLQPNAIPVEYVTSRDLGSVQIHFNQSLLFAIINLIDNALRAAKARVCVSYVVVKKQLEIRIHNDGGGVPSGLQQEMGKPFIHGKDNLHNAKGLGLGYYLSNFTIEKNNGSLALISEGDGATTVITLPCTFGVSA